MSKDTKIVARVVEWLDANVEEQSLPYEVRLDSARLRDSIETWRNELTEKGNQLLKTEIDKHQQLYNESDDILIEWVVKIKNMNDYCLKIKALHSK